ncbi:hypothetical protein Tco_0710187 [Tanacetum coccineum]
MHTRTSNSELVEPLTEPKRTLNRRRHRRNRRVSINQRNNPPKNPRIVYPPILNINHFRHFLDTLENLFPMDDEPMWAADRVVASTPGSAITIPETANKFAIKDSDYAGANLDRKSTTGGCQFLGRRLITWQCKKQTIVATSTTEAEYVAAASCCRQVLWIQNQMLYYGFNFMNTKIYIDNESTICIVKNPVYHSKTKHIAIRNHFIRDAYEKKLIQVLKIHTNDNVADLLTKAFDVSRFQFLVVSIRMINP